jgi:glyoxylase I family protein
VKGEPLVFLGFDVRERAPGGTMGLHPPVEEICSASGCVRGWPVGSAVNFDGRNAAGLCGTVRHALGVLPRPWPARVEVLGFAMIPALFDKGGASRSFEYARVSGCGRGAFAAGLDWVVPITGVHHVALICSDYARSRDFYTRVLGFAVLAENERVERRSWKLDLAVPGGGRLEVFSFPSPPTRPTRPEACGLRHLAFAVAGLDAEVERLAALGVEIEPVRVDEFTGRRFTFIADPDGLPIELYEVA